MARKQVAPIGAVSGKTVYEFDTNGVFLYKYKDADPDGLGVLQGTLMSRPDLASNWRVSMQGHFMIW